MEIIHPLRVIIDGEITLSFFSGHIEMNFQNDYVPIDKLYILIGQKEKNEICLHDFQIKINENPFSLTIEELEEAQTIYKQQEKNGKQVAIATTDNSFTKIAIPNVLQNQIVTISVNFELPIKFITNNIIGLFFPLTYPGIYNDEILKCDHFDFTIRFPSFQFNERSITSNPEGKIDLSTSKYMINNLDQTLTNISILINLSKIDIKEKSLASCCGKYGTLTFVPFLEKQKVNHSGEEFIFIVDCSGSMNGHEIELAAQCLLFFVKSLPENCYFNIIRFGTNYEPFFEKTVEYNELTSKIALEITQDLKADLGRTFLSKPLSFVFSNPISKKNKMRRIFILTDGFVFDSSEVFELVRENSATTMCSAIGIGNYADRELVKRIGNEGNGFYDFVLSGDDMRSVVINQLSQSLNGLCKCDISIENNESIEILPPLSSCKFSPGIPVTFYFKSSNEFENNLHIIVEIEGNSKPLIIKMIKLPSTSVANKSFKYIFNYENIKILENMKQTKEVISKITQLSIEYGILTPYTAIIGTQEYVSQDEKEKIESLINELNKKYFTVFAKTLTNEHYELLISIDHRVEDLKQQINKITFIPYDMIRIIYNRHQLEEGYKLSDLSVRPDSTFFVILRLRGGGITDEKDKCSIPTTSPSRNFVGSKTDDLISIISEQTVKGSWEKIPIYLNDSKYSNIIKSVKRWCKDEKIVCQKNCIIATLSSLVYIYKYKKECYKMWSLIFKKGINWLKSINSKIDWIELILCLSYPESDQIFESDESDEENSEIIIQNKIIYVLNEDEKEASVFGIDSASKIVVIPRSINHKGNEFIITKILKKSFKNCRKIKSLQFQFDSQITTFEKFSFVNSAIEHIVIPSSLSKLNEGWCHGTPHLNKIAIMAKNANFAYLDEKMIIAKSDAKSKEFDVLVFARRDIKTIKIPSFIKIIGSFAFEQSSIENVSIPPQVHKIGHFAFASCDKLKKIEISIYSRDLEIEKDAFENCMIENFSIPERFKSLLNI